MDQEMNDALRALLGDSMWRSARAVDMEMFTFGEKVQVRDRRGRERTVGSRGLHVQCAWHITRGDELLIGYRDVFHAAGASGGANEADWEPIGANLRDRFLSRWFAGREGGFGVEGVVAKPWGGLQLNLSDAHCLELFPDRYWSNDRAAEQWRFLENPGTPESSHLTVTSSGFAWEGEHEDKS